MQRKSDIWFPLWFLRFMSEHDAEVRFVNNIHDCDHTFTPELISVECFIEAAFDWGKTREGIEYWSNLNDKYKRYIDNRSKLLSKVMTLELSEFLDSYSISACESYMLNFDPDRYIADSPINCFAWYSTREGYRFWSNVNANWLKEKVKEKTMSLPDGRIIHLDYLTETACAYHIDSDGVTPKKLEDKIYSDLVDSTLAANLKGDSNSKKESCIANKEESCITIKIASRKMPKIIL